MTREVILLGLGRKPDGTIGHTFTRAEVLGAGWPLPRVRPVTETGCAASGPELKCTDTGQPMTGEGLPIRCKAEAILLLREIFRCSLAFAGGILDRAVAVGVLVERREHGRTYIIPTTAWYDWLGKALAGERCRRRKGGER